jgi:23S rRNA (adenine1618-N6)-methyltransferase
VSINEHSIETIDFSDPEAVKSLNQALFKLLRYPKWDIQHIIFALLFLCRADYIHYIADLLAESNNGIIPKGHGFKYWILVLVLIVFIQ